MTSSATSIVFSKSGSYGQRLKSAAGQFGDVQLLASLEVEPLHQLARAA